MRAIEGTTKAQRDTILRLMREHDADGFGIERDEDHDTWLFVTLFRGHCDVTEVIVNDDGTVDD